jgi:isopentenyl-diphosphate delta-isomerase
VADELWQLYSEQGTPLFGAGARKDDVGSRGLLHGASHVWIWRMRNNKPEVLLQKRAAVKNTWPNHLDISAAGHIDLGEEPLTAALRETNEEIGLVVPETQLELFAVHRTRLVAGNKIENEFQWLYLLQLIKETPLILQTTELAATLWIPLQEFRAQCMGDAYVPHGQLYYDIVYDAIDKAQSAIH